MKILKMSLILIVTSLFIWGCDNQPKTEINDGHSAHESQLSESESIRLNNGEKWLVNEDMKPFILESETILNEFIETNSTDYTALARKLKEKNSGLINSCTMKGEGHDELHKWLHPHMDLIKEIEREKNEDEAQSIVVELKKSFETYHNYFQ